MREFDERVRARDLAEKRRLAPGWLDSDVRVLEPERKGDVGVGGVGEGMKRLSLGGGGAGEFDGLTGGDMEGNGHGGHGRGGASEMAVPDEGEELDRAFGGMGFGKGGGN